MVGDADSAKPRHQDGRSVTDPGHRIGRGFHALVDHFKELPLDVIARIAGVRPTPRSFRAGNRASSRAATKGQICMSRPQARGVLFPHNLTAVVSAGPTPPGGHRGRGSATVPKREATLYRFRLTFAEGRDDSPGMVRSCAPAQRRYDDRRDEKPSWKVGTQCVYIA